MSRISKIFFVAIVFSLTFLITQGSLAVGFSKGNEFKVRPLSGQANLYCYDQNEPGGPSYRFEVVNCQANEWSPAIFDFFVGPQGVQADRVRLTSVREDGSQESKEQGYNSQTGRSSRTFNLGVRTITQRPLLRAGQNKISFVMSQNGNAVGEGEFTAQVSVLPGARCPYSSVSTSVPCHNPYAACDDYFDKVGPECR
jgi:hypothetical protein